MPKSSYPKSRARIFPAVWNGEKHELSIRMWAQLTNRSTTFITKYINEADDLGIKFEDQMQYAIDHKTNYGNCGSRPRPKVRNQEGKISGDETVRNVQKTLFMMALRASNQEER